MSRFAHTFAKQLVQTRNYHPGYGPGFAISLPKPPPDEDCYYYEPVWGNGVQRNQLRSGVNSYSTNDVLSKVKKTKEFLEQNGKQVEYVPTSIGSSLFSAIASCPDLQFREKYKFCEQVEQEGMTIKDNNNLMFNNTPENRTRIIEFIEETYNTNCKMKKVLKSAMFGIFSNFADSIYNANDYLILPKFKKEDNTYAFISRYPSEVSQRNIERARVVATCLWNGIYPIILNNDFEGEANVKYFGKVKNNKQNAIVYDSARSKLQVLHEMNSILNKLELPEISSTLVTPKQEFKEQFYHLDCVLNFSHSNNQDLLVFAEEGLDNVSYDKLNKIFKTKIPVSAKDDPLIANMIVTDNCVVGGDINNAIKENFKLINKEYQGYAHPSRGGGGAHKCCSNVICKKQPLTIRDWVYFFVNNNMNIDVAFFHAIFEEYNRVGEFYKNL